MFDEKDVDYNAHSPDTFRGIVSVTMRVTLFPVDMLITEYTHVILLDFGCALVHVLHLKWNCSNHDDVNKERFKQSFHSKISLFSKEAIS